MLQIIEHVAEVNRMQLAMDVLFLSVEALLHDSWQPSLVA